MPTSPQGVIHCRLSQLPYRLVVRKKSISGINKSFGNFY